GDVRVLERSRLTEPRDEVFARSVIEIGDDDARSFVDEQLGYRPADAVGPAGDDGDLSVQLVGHVDSPPTRPYAVSGDRDELDVQRLKTPQHIGRHIAEAALARRAVLVL